MNKYISISSEYKNQFNQAMGGEGSANKKKISEIGCDFPSKITIINTSNKTLEDVA